VAQRAYPPSFCHRSERKHLLWTAPHLTRALPIVVPLYDPFPKILFTAPYYWAGVKAYDFVAGAKGALEPSYWMSRRELRERFPQLKVGDVCVCVCVCGLWAVGL
jgi:glycerol-3-phosphate dehydrogenase